ncbi:hypothetical protein CJ485_03605 [Priestia filamentosa]|nr:hypothetical protein CJ485_03605 [Priestia filamentosa]
MYVKQFEQDIGISPKLFSQIVRFQCSLSMFMNDKNYSICDIIEESGYYDQAHLMNIKNLVITVQDN